MISVAIREAELPERCKAHGLRKAAARRLAEAGCSASEIAAITGHKTLAEVECYTRAANQERLARRAIQKQLETRPGKLLGDQVANGSDDRHGFGQCTYEFPGGCVPVSGSIVLGAAALVCGTTV